MLQASVTIPIAAVNGLLSGPRARGIATPQWISAMLDAAGIAPARLQEVRSRVTPDQYTALFTAIVANLDDECMSHLSRPLRQGSFALMVRSTTGARTVESALHRVADCFGLLQDDVALVVVRDGPLSGFALEINEDASSGENYLHELLLRVFWRLLAWLHGRRLVPRRFDFSYPQPAYAAAYERIFPARLRYTLPRSAAWFDAAALAVPVRRDTQAMQEFLRATPGNLLGPRLVEPATAARVRSLLQQSSRSWPDLMSTSERLHMSVSALQRHLAAEGTSFQTLKDELRRDLAIVRLNSSQVPLATLAGDLGFADSATFQRAFKNWTGSAPGSYRKRPVEASPA